MSKRFCKNQQFSCYQPQSDSMKLPTKCADLSLTLTNEQVILGQRYNFRIINNGPVTAKDVRLSMANDTGVILPSSQWTLGQGTGGIDLGSLPPGFDSGNDIFIFASTPSFVSAVLTSTTPDCNPGNNAVFSSFPPR